MGICCNSEYKLLSMIADNKSRPFNSSLIKKILTTKLTNQLQQIATPRCIYGDSNILETINFIFDFKFQSDGPPCTIYSLQSDNEATDISQAPNIIFFIYPQPDLINIIASMILKNQLGSSIKKNYYLYLVPTMNYLCHQRLQEKQIKDKVKIKYFNFDLIPFDEDLFSLQFSYRMDPLEQDACILESLLKMAKMVGKMKNYFAIGHHAVRMMRKMDEALEGIPEMEDASEGSYLMVLDRAIDYVTPMVTPFSYEGLLDLFFGIKFNKIQIPGHLIDSKKTLEAFLLNNPRDKHYRKIAGMYIREVPEYLKKFSQELGQKIKQRKQQAKSIEDLNFINQELMPEFLLLQYHKSIAAFLLTHINESQFFNTATMEAHVLQTCDRAEGLDYLSVFYPIQQVLKLEILSSQVSSFGNYFSRFEKKIFQYLLNSYHPRHILTLRNLAQQSILRSTKQPLKWKQLCQKLDLIPDTPRSYTYIHTIYSALLVRFTQMFLTDNLNAQTMNLVCSENSLKGSFRKIRAGDTVYLYVVGGVTYPEVQAFRVLGKKLEVKFVICATQLTSGQKIVKKCFV